MVVITVYKLHVQRGGLWKGTWKNRAAVPRWEVQETGFSFFFNLCFWLRWLFVAVRGLSLAAASGVYSSLRCAGFVLRWLLLLQSTISRRAGFSSCGTRAQ